MRCLGLPSQAAELREEFRASERVLFSVPFAPGSSSGFNNDA